MKKKLFFLITILIIPIFLLAIFELTLRVIGFGESYPLFVQKGNNYHTNQNFPEKYFTSKDISIPELIDQKFPVLKKNNVYRIITLGGSTTAGFPYEVNINWPFFIKHYLSETITDKKIELINLGISAINSHTVLDMLDQVFQIDPDLILIYMGHNEFYGAMGVASSQSIGGSRSIIKLVLWLKQIRTYQLIDKLISIIRSSNTDQPSGKSLMNQMIGQSNISRRDQLYQKTCDNFSKNLDEIIESIKNNNIPVIIGTLVSNLRDQYPLGQSTALQEDKSLNQFYKDALKSEQENPLEALRLYRKILNQNPDIAEAHFRLGKVYSQLGKSDSALYYFKEASDYDLMPFRAPSEMNVIIRNIAKKHSITLADGKKLFFEHTQSLIPGNDLFLEHLHPNQKGYALLALAMLQAINDENILDIPMPISSDSFLSIMPFTALDLRIGELKIKGLLDDFPFNGRTVFQADSIYIPQVDSIARKHVYKGIFWDAAHFELGDYYNDMGEHQLALNEYNAVLINDPTNPSAIYKIGDIHASRQDWKKAIAYYNRALEITPDEAYLFAKLGKALMIDEQTEAGLLALEQVIQLEKKRKTIKPEDMSTLYYLMGVGYTRKEIWPKAEAAVNLALKYDRKSYPAFKLKQEIKKRKNK